MAEMKVCPNCGAKNPSSNRFCEDCGYDMNKVSASASVTSAPKAPLYCPNGHTVGDASLGFCDVCGEKLTSESPRPKVVDIPIESVPLSDIPIPTKLYIDETHGKKCPSCGAMNSEDGLFCEECGTALSDDSIEPILKSEDEPDKSKSVIRNAPTKRELPDIPDIMRVLTNDDMKK